MKPDFSKLCIVSGSANRELAQRIVDSIGIPLGALTVDSFPDGESFVKFDENIRGKDLFIIQPTCPPTNHNLMELLIILMRRGEPVRIASRLFYLFMVMRVRIEKISRACPLQRSWWQICWWQRVRIVF